MKDEEVDKLFEFQMLALSMKGEIQKEVEGVNKIQIMQIAKLLTRYLLRGAEKEQSIIDDSDLSFDVVIEEAKKQQTA